jgi:pyrroline-5-carboxylate reductase
VRLAFIGSGVMGEAIIAAVLERHLTQPSDITACDVVAQRREHLSRAYGIATAEHIADAITESDLIILAVKPQDFSAVARDLRGLLAAGQTIVSIMAGVSLAALRDSLGHEVIVRAMPNTPAQVGEGMTVWTATEAVSASARENAHGILGAMGQELYVTEEKYVDMATAVSGSGPAFVFLVMEAMIDAAVHIGLRREMATEMVLQTVLGSARYAQASGRHPADLRNQVTSPGGTTAEGLLALEEAGVRAAFAQAIIAAYERARQLGGKASKP